MNSRKSKTQSTIDERCLWPLASLEQALSYIAQNLFHTRADHAPKFEGGDDRDMLREWFDSAAEALGLKTEPMMVQYAQVDELLRKGAPALFIIRSADAPRACIVLSSKGEKVHLLGTDYKTYARPRAWLRSLYCFSLEKEAAKEIDELLEQAHLAERNKPQAREQLLRQRIGDAWLGDCWLLRQPISDSLWRHVQKLGLHWRMISLVLLHIFYYVLWLGSWWLIGKSVLQGRVEQTWLLAWGLILLTMIPARMLIRWLQGVLSVSAGSLLKQKLCYGALHLDPDDIRQRGVGQLLGSVIESEQLETLSINGGFVGLLAVIELFMAAFVLSLGLAGGLMALALCLWTVLTFFFSWRYYKRRKQWSGKRLLLTHNLVERMVGHRTRRLQEQKSHWHEDEDKELAAYTDSSAKMDRLAALFVALVARGWVVAALVFLSPFLVAVSTSTASIAVSIGGILLAFRALQKLTFSLNNIAGAAISWQYVSELIKASGYSEESAASVLHSANHDHEKSQHLVRLTNVDFQYQNGGRYILRQNSLSIKSGDRILLQGPSGSGKSTLASILTALRKPTSGLMFLNGLDDKTWGARKWRQHIVAAPQFHENRVLTGSFAFNLLMGRDWPPTQSDLQEAEEVCRALGLGTLLDEMPAGIMQMVGETGWQMSHGEKSRLYIARALLQNAPLVIFDESFAALDPETLLGVFKYVDQKVNSLMVVAHV